MSLYDTICVAASHLACMCVCGGGGTLVCVYMSVCVYTVKLEEHSYG